MRHLAIDLRAKILFGGVVLLIPLVVSLWSLAQYGGNQIRTATLEKAGLEVTRPLWKTIFGWQVTGPYDPPDESLVEDYREFQGLIDAKGQDLEWSQPNVEAAGYPWTDPHSLGQQIQAGAGDEVQFATIQNSMVNQVLYLADTSGLVLDPDLDSWYLMMGLYQSLPHLIQAVTELSAITNDNLRNLDDRRRLAVYTQAKEIRATTTVLQAQIGRSVRALGRSWGPVPGYEQAMAELMGPLEGTAQRIEEQTLQGTLGAPYDRSMLSGQIVAMASLLEQFHLAGIEALQTMLDHRIRAYTTNLTVAFSVALMGLTVGLLVLLMVVNGVKRRTSQLVAALGTVAQGDLGREVPPRLLTSSDELGQLARSVKVLQDDLRAQVQSLAQVTNTVAALGSSLAANAQESAAAIEEMAASAGQVARFAEGQRGQSALAEKEMTAMSAQVSACNALTQGMVAQFDRFSRTMQDNRKRIGEESAEMRQAGELAQALNRTGEEGERSLESLRESIGGVVQRTKEVQEIVRIILDITDQTNLLSMNAAIEAAHAGQAGRGFSVVAEEIRKLAETSSQQTQNITRLVEGISTAAAQTLTRSEATGQSFRTVRRDILSVRNAALAIGGQMARQEEENDRLLEGVDEFHRFYGQLSASMVLQVNQSQTVQVAIGELEAASTQISQSMQEQKHGMEQATSAVIQVRDTTNDLARIVGDLTELMGRFKTRSILEEGESPGQTETRVPGGSRTSP